MNTKKITFEDAKREAAEYSYILAYEFSRVLLGRTNETSVSWDECQEAYLFDEGAEVHIYRDGDMLHAVKCSAETDEDVFVDRVYELAGQFSSIGRRVRVREYLVPDEDGQVTVEYTRLVAIEQEER